MNKTVVYSPISFNEKISAFNNETSLVVSDESGNRLEAHFNIENDKIVLTKNNNHKRTDDLLEMIALEYLFGHNNNILEINFKNIVFPEKSVLKNYFKETNQEVQILRSSFFQLRAPWYKKIDYDGKHELSYMHTGELLHPVRENPQGGMLYSRYVPEMQKTLSFRVIDLEKDLDTFHDWHNQERVNLFWELKGTKEEHTAYIKKLLADNHMVPTIAEIDGEPYGYFELYWAYEDRLGPYYPSNQFDRGFHFLIGNAKFLGAVNTDGALKSLVHLVFLEDERTTKLMAEPRADNARVIKYVDSFAVWKRLYEFDFPHKRALLIEARREVFFMGKFL